MLDNVFYKLDEDGVTPISTTLEDWVSGCTDVVRVASTIIGDAKVSTVFTGVDLNVLEGKTPLVFETMVLGGNSHGFCQKYSTWSCAEKGHWELCGNLAGATL